MITAASFKQIVKQHVVVPTGVRASGVTYSLPGNIKLELMLDQHGWDETLGWGFIARLSDESQRDELGNFKNFYAERDIRPLDLPIDNDIWQTVYAHYPKLKSGLRSGWYEFYDEQHLIALLNLVMPKIFTFATNWKPSATDPH